MSADNWTLCPTCLKNEVQKLEKKRLQLDKDYGKVPSEEYLKRVKEIQEIDTMINDRLFEHTFREDYEIGADSVGFFELNYRGGCKECGTVITVKLEGSIYNKNDWKVVIT